MSLTKEQGEALVRLARSTVEDFVRGEVATTTRIPDDPFLAEERGTFVTLKTMGGDLRGCIGFPFPAKPLGAAVVEAAIAASAYDPRFPKVAPSELDGLLVEVSALTSPETVEYRSPTELPDLVRVGVDGLIVTTPHSSGLLLPQVATEHDLAPDEFLSQTCLKAGLAFDAWLTDKVVIQRFQAEVFSETTPRGEVRTGLE